MDKDAGSKKRRISPSAKKKPSPKRSSISKTGPKAVLVGKDTSGSESDEVQVRHRRYKSNILPDSESGSDSDSKMSVDDKKEGGKF